MIIVKYNLGQTYGHCAYGFSQNGHAEVCIGSGGKTLLHEGEMGKEFSGTYKFVILQGRKMGVPKKRNKTV